MESSTLFAPLELEFLYRNKKKSAFRIQKEQVCKHDTTCSL